MIPYSYIAIEGVIGAGKTTIANFIADKLQAKLLLEEFEDNPFLAKFYIDQEKYAFPLELSFLAARYRQAKQALLQPTLFDDNIVSDFVLYKSLVFASITLNGEEEVLYRNLFDIMFSQIPIPDLTIYLYHTVDQLKSNIIKRGRDYEQKISFEYLAQLNETYLQYFRQLETHRIVILDGKNFDILENPKAKVDIMEILESSFPIGLTYL